jgi:thiol-disulfide isomerase/thioredoxin
MVYVEINKKNAKMVEKINKYLKDKKKHVFILFYMEGCGPCNMTRPEWSKLKNVLSNDFLKKKNIIIISADKDLYNKFINVGGEPMSFPTMRYITNAGKKMKNYEDSNISKKDRSIDSFVEWIKVEMNGSQKGGKMTKKRTITKKSNKKNFIKKQLSNKTTKRLIKKSLSRRKKYGGDLVKPIYGELLDWVPPPTSVENFKYLSLNTSAIHMLENNIANVNWKNIAKNLNGMGLIDNNWNIIYRMPMNFRTQIIHKIIQNPNSTQLLIKRFPDIMAVINTQTYKDFYINILFKRSDIMSLLQPYYETLRYYIVKKDVNSDLFSNPTTFDFIYDLYLKKIIKMDWYNLSLNPSPKAIAFLKKNPSEIIWATLSKNPSAIDLLAANPEKIDLHNLLENPNGFTLLEKYWDDPKLEFKEQTITCIIALVNNPNSLPFIDAHWDELKEHISTMQFFAILYKDDIFPFLEKHWAELKDKVSWGMIALNPNISQFIKKHWDEAEKDSVFWEIFVRNPNVIDIIEKNRELFITDRQAVNSLYINPAIFKLDQAQMREQMKDYSENFSIYINNPEKLTKRLRIGKDGFPCDPLFDPDCHESLPHACEEDGEDGEMTCMSSEPLFPPSQIKRSREYDDQIDVSNKLYKT